MIDWLIRLLMTIAHVSLSFMLSYVTWLMLHARLPQTRADREDHHV